MNMGKAKFLAIAAIQVLSYCIAHAIGPYRPPLSSFAAARKSPMSTDRPDVIDECEEKYRSVVLDHFSWATPPGGKETFQQRYFVCDKHWKSVGGQKGPIFFYIGNEADVTLYLNNTGLMWESADDFGALLVFAEHRYYGKSKPYKTKSLKEHMQFLTSEQAMADYAELITELREDLEAAESAVIGFGGSYGGMLGTWFRYKYPHVIDGVIAGSAPIWDFEGEDPPYDPLFFSKIVTRDATPEAGANKQCVPNMRQAWKVLFERGRTASGRKDIRSAMRICHGAPLENRADVESFAQWLQSAFDYMAMGNYPYPSAYILNGAGKLPAFPMRVACDYLGAENPTDTGLLEGLAGAAGVFYNYTHDIPCFNYTQGPNKETEEDANFWDYQYCTEMFMPAARDGEHDMFWPQPFDRKAAVQQCQDTWGVTPRPMWATIQWGGRNLDALSNVVFSNGNYDPWSGGGVLDSLSDSVVAVLIDQGAHHLDLMFSNAEDPPSVQTARAIERTNIRKWVEEVRQRHARSSAIANVKEVPHR